MKGALRWMKVVVLLAGALGVLSFFVCPFFVFETDAQSIRATPYELLVGFANPAHDKLGFEKPGPDCVKEALTPSLVGVSCNPQAAQSHRSFVPLYFISSAVLVLIGLIAIALRRLSGWLGLVTLAASLLAIGGWLREMRVDRYSEGSHVAYGAALLGVSGVIALLASIAVMIWREPERKKKKPTVVPVLPEARVVQ